jgi:hypothetical protein
VNGVAKKHDKYFLSDFYCSDIAGTNLVLGNVPSTEAHVRELKRLGVGSVLSVQSRDEVEAQGVSQPLLESYFKKTGTMTFVHHPVSDKTETEFCEQLFQASVELNHLLSDPSF